MSGSIFDISQPGRRLLGLELELRLLQLNPALLHLNLPLLEGGLHFQLALGQAQRLLLLLLRRVCLLGFHINQVSPAGGRCVS